MLGVVFPQALKGAGQRLVWVRMSLFLAAFLVLALAPAVQAAAPQRFALTGPRMDTETGDILVRLGVDVDDTDGLGDMLRDGAIMELTIEAALERVHTLWPNTTLSEKTLTALLRHNPLTREFSLTMPGDDTYIVDKNLQRLFAATWHKIVFSLGSLALLQEADPESAYRITLAISLRHTEVPPWMAKTFLFWSWDVVEPVSIIIPFTF